MIFYDFFFFGENLGILLDKICLKTPKHCMSGHCSISLKNSQHFFGGSENSHEIISKNVSAICECARHNSLHGLFDYYN